MGRDIKFRGKCSGQSKYAGEWVEGGLVVPQEITNNEVLIIRAIADGCTTTYHVDADTIGQFTGFHDKNGKEIYEGDIVTSNRYPFVNDRKPNYYGVIEWFDYDGCFSCYYEKAKGSKCRGVSVGMPVDFDMDDAKEYEVVGNIFDNKELLEEVK